MPALSPLFCAVARGTHSRTVCGLQREVVRLNAQLAQTEAKLGLCEEAISDTWLARVLDVCRHQRDLGYGGADILHDNVYISMEEQLQIVPMLRALGFTVNVFNMEDCPFSVYWSECTNVHHGSCCPPWRLLPSGELSECWKRAYVAARDLRGICRW